jgi:hypothetical protein
MRWFRAECLLVARCGICADPFLEAPMTRSEVLEVMRELAAAVHLLSGYPIAEQMPQIHVVPQTLIAELVCVGPCRVQAFYHRDFGVFVDERLKLDSDLYARSILLHELVHHAQEVAGQFEALPSECQRRTAAETEAYEIQNRFLAQHGSPHRIPADFALPCPDS